eukprot:1659920-Pleurochrysis_carterae.AAC.2
MPVRLGSRLLTLSQPPRKTLPNTACPSYQRAIHALLSADTCPATRLFPAACGTANSADASSRGAASLTKPRSHRRIRRAPAASACDAIIPVASSLACAAAAAAAAARACHRAHHARASSCVAEARASGHFGEAAKRSACSLDARACA